jgi:hypothetical protein
LERAGTGFVEFNLPILNELSEIPKIFLGTLQVSSGVPPSRMVGIPLSLLKAIEQREQELQTFNEQL